MEDKLGNTSICISFPNNKLIPQLYGEQDKHLLRLEKLLSVSAYTRGNIISLSGEAHNVERAKYILETLYKNLEKGVDIGMAEVEDAVRMTLDPSREGKVKKQLEGDQ